MTFNVLLKWHVWEKSGSRVKCKNALRQSDSSIFKLTYFKNYWRYKVDFLHAGTYLLKLPLDDVILHEWGQACSGMPKEVIKTKISKIKGGIKLILCIQLHIF